MAVLLISKRSSSIMAFGQSAARSEDDTSNGRLGRAEQQSASEENSSGQGAQLITEEPWQYRSCMTNTCYQALLRYRISRVHGDAMESRLIHRQWLR